MMPTALDAPPEVLDAAESDFVAKIREHGWFATQVFKDDDHPGFSYTTGFWITLGAPEIIVFSLSKESAYQILWGIFHNIRDGLALPTGMPIQDYTNFPAYLFPVAKEHYPEHVGWSRWFYGGDDFPCLQFVWPDPNGVFPWQAGSDGRFSKSQPDLSERGWSSALAQ